MESKEFCSCTDLNCPNHPTNHAKGCNLCILKCLKLGEIPSCFFNDISKEKPENGDYSYKGFANFILKHNNKNNK